MEEIATIQVHDLESRDDGLVMVRCSQDRVALAISLRSDGDIEVILTANDAKIVVDALNAAIRAATCE